ncbi:MAG: hypothetical protein SF162_19365 [bacterium]|nr:hypothetical protein [bacterium]
MNTQKKAYQAPQMTEIGRIGNFVNAAMGSVVGDGGAPVITPDGTLLPTKRMASANL